MNSLGTSIVNGIYMVVINQILQIGTRSGMKGIIHESNIAHVSL
jgi:hypothetical protein